MRHNSNVTTRQVVRYVRHRLGPDGVDRLLALADETRPVAVLEDLTEWSSYEEAKRLYEAAAELLGGVEALRSAGSHVDRSDGNPEIQALFLSLGSPAAVLSFITEMAAKFSTVVRMHALEVTDDHGVVEATSVEGFPRYRALCELTAGLLAQSSVMFGYLPAAVEERECELRGDDRCLYVVRWDTEVLDHTHRIEQLETSVRALTERFDGLKSTVADLISGADVDTVLERILTTAAHAVRAPRYLLAVRLTDQAPVRAHAVGFEPGTIDVFAERLLSGEPLGTSGSCLAVDIASATRQYGRIAAVNPDGVSFLPDEESILGAYAGLSAAALESATALEEARSQAGVARTLLELARQLANVTTRSETAQRLAAAVPRVVGCDLASVLVYDRTRQCLRFEGMHGFPSEQAGLLDGLEIDETDTPYVRTLVEQRQPFFVDTGSEDDFVQGMLSMMGLSSVAVVPIVGAGEFHGVVTAGVHVGRLTPDGDLLERLEGVADQAATALGNALLLETMQEQALHDPLTRTPNRRLLEDRVERALAAARRSMRHTGLLFLDLDDFKRVNDTFGHEVGDQLLRQVAERLAGVVRASDTVARLGGDEFAVLLPDLGAPDETQAVVDKLLDALAEPFCTDGHQMIVGASIGAAASPQDGDDYRSLLKAADVRMYATKGRRAA